ncbi:hypothetical protein D6745_04305 [Candidatus Woesearchaeota archaeon]|nr:MAG: hypothetical protein D6745_04305 [Candidatus Woesearchaeota archaeon]
MPSKLNVKKRDVIGIEMPVTIHGLKESKKVKAKIDTGASLSSIDMKLASEVGLSLGNKTKLVKQAHGNTLRPTARVKLTINGETMKTEFTLADRRHLKYKVLIGLNVLKKGGFLIDPLKK